MFKPNKDKSKFGGNKKSKFLGKKGKLSRFKREDKDSDFPQRMRKRFCRFCQDKSMVIDYKNSGILERMTTERGKIMSRRYTNNCSKHQRQVASAIKRARYLSLIPYTK